MTKIKTFGYTVDINYLGETSRGIAYEGKIYKDNELVAFHNNNGDGGFTSVDILPEKRDEVNCDILTYFQQFELDKELTLDDIGYSDYYKFVENLIDILEGVDYSFEDGFTA